MADNLDHLEFQPISRPVRERKKSRAFPPRIVRYRRPRIHAADLTRDADRVLAELDEQPRPPGIAPKQIVDVQAHRRINEQRLATAGLLVLDSSVPERVVALARDPTMTTTRERLEEYGEAEDLPERAAEEQAPDEGPRARYEDVFDAIDGFERRPPVDRISDRLHERLAEEDGGSVDIIADLYSPDDPELRQAWIDEVATLADRHGTTVDTFDDPAIGVTLIRLNGDADLVGELSFLDQIASLDIPSQPSLTAPGLVELQDLEALEPDVQKPDPNAPAIGVIDSGVRAGHPFLEAAVIGADALHPVFNSAGEDGFGHGTLVAGLALYGDVVECARRGAFVAPFPLASVRIFDDDGKIPEGVNPAKLLEGALEHLADEYDCRVICLSLGDHNEPFLGGEASPLAALIDDIARALDVVIVVPTGNIQHSSLAAPAQLLRRWPAYLADPGNELLSPSPGGSRHHRRRSCRTRCHGSRRSLNRSCCNSRRPVAIRTQRAWRTGRSKAGASSRWGELGLRPTRRRDPRRHRNCHRQPFRSSRPPVRYGPRFELRGCTSGERRWTHRTALPASLGGRDSHAAPTGRTPSASARRS